MSENSERPESHPDKGKHIDMYHFFSRKDVIAYAVFILLALLVLLYLGLSGTSLLS